MFEVLKKIIDDNPHKNNFYRIVKSNKGLFEWIKNQFPDVEDINEKIYLILNNKNDCKYNNNKKFINVRLGYGYCATADKCQCLKERCSTTSMWLDDPIKAQLSSVKRKTTNIQKYGVDNVSKNVDIKTKKVKTLVDNYGVVNPMHSEEIKNTLYKNNVIKYGVKTPSMLSDMTKKQKDTKFKKYGYWNTGIHIPIEAQNKLNDIEWLIEQNKTHTPLQISSILGVSNSLIYKIFEKHEIDYKKHYKNSAWQSDLVSFINNFDISCIQNDRTILNGKEIDIFIKSLNLAIECNGTFWHSEIHGNKDKNYHLDKLILAKNKGIRLIHITDSDWFLKNDIVKSRIISLLGKTKKIYARKCVIKSVSSSDEYVFFTENHIQGHVHSKICLGLFYEDVLVSAMSFGESRFSKNKIELLRFANQLNVTVVGGASKLFKFYTKSFNPSIILSYSDKNWSEGNLYRTLGFSYSHTSAPSYKYTKDYHILENRVKYQKHKLNKLFENYNDSLTEWENMQNNGYDRIWDCGNDVWVYYNNN